MKRFFKSFVVAMALLMSTTGFLAACNSGDNSSSGNSGSVSSSDSAGTSSSEEMGEVKSLTITNKPEGNQLYVGADRSVTLGYTTDPADAQVSVKWTSGDPAIATVDENGKVTGIKPGSVVITVTAEGTNISAKLPLTVLEYVEPKPVTAISISGVEETSTIKRGETKTIEIVSEPADCDPYEIEWTYNKDIIDVVEAPEGFNIVSALKDEEFIERVAEQTVEIHNAELKELRELKILYKQLEETKKKLENITEAICAGIFNSYTQAKMVELTNTKTKLSEEIGEEESKTIKPLQVKKVILFLKNYTFAMKCAEGEITLEEKKRLFDMFIKEVIFDGERMLIVLKTTDEPEPPERKGFSETETQVEDERKKNRKIGR